MLAWIHERERKFLAILIRRPEGHLNLAHPLTCTWHTTWSNPFLDTKRDHEGTGEGLVRSMRPFIGGQEEEEEIENTLNVLLVACWFELLAWIAFFPAIPVNQGHAIETKWSRPGTTTSTFLTTSFKENTHKKALQLNASCCLSKCLSHAECFLLVPVSCASRQSRPFLRVWSW